jgi:O-antigen ligase
MVGLLVLLPALAQPLIAIALVIALLGGWLAWRSVAYPLALAGIPTLLEAVVGQNPLPKGGVTFLYIAWVGIAVAFAAMRGTHPMTARALLYAPVILSVALLGVMILLLGRSPDQPYGSTEVQLYVADNLVFLLGAIFVGARRSDLRLFFAVTLAVAAGGGLLIVLKFLGGGAQMTLENRFSLSAQEYPIYLGRSSADGLIIAIYAALTATRAWTRMAAVAVLPLLVVALLASGSRGPIVALVVGVLALVALTATDGRARRRLLVVGGGLLGAAVVVPLVVPGSTIGRSLSTLVGGSSGLSSNGRSQLWSQAFTAFAQHPLLGIGTGGFGALNPAEPYPHNILLEVAVELGVIGALLILGIVLSAAVRLGAVWRTTRGRDRLDAAVLITLFVTALVNALFSGAIQDNREIWVWGGLGLGMSARLAATRLRAPRLAAGAGVDLMRPATGGPAEQGST